MLSDQQSTAAVSTPPATRAEPAPLPEDPLELAAAPPDDPLTPPELVPPPPLDAPPLDDPPPAVAGGTTAVPLEEPPAAGAAPELLAETSAPPELLEPGGVVAPDWLAPPPFDGPFDEEHADESSPTANKNPCDERAIGALLYATSDEYATNDERARLPTSAMQRADWSLL